MPDHLHILINNHKGHSIIDFVRDVKYALTREGWLFGFSGKIFQQSFYDRFIRSQEELAQMTQYVAENPLRKGLSVEKRQPPFVGSDVYIME